MGRGKGSSAGKWVKTFRKQLLCVLLSILLAGLWALIQGEGSLREGALLERDGYGGREREYSLLLDGLLEEETKVSVRLKPRAYTKTEAEAAFEALLEELPARIAGKNENLQNVREDLDLIRTVPGYGFRLSWYPEDTELLSYEGEVLNKNLTEDRETSLRVVMTDGTFDRTYVVPVTLRPRIQTDAEALLSALFQKLEEADNSQVTSGSLKLPEAVGGHKLAWRMEPSRDWMVLIGLGAAAALLLWMKERSDTETKRKERETELLLDYSELVSKLIVYLGAGLTIKNAFLTIAELAEQNGNAQKEDVPLEKRSGKFQRKEKTRNSSAKPRYLSEELRKTAAELRQGIPEGTAYRSFGRRCGLHPYVKLCALLEQNRKNGGRNLSGLLTAEMEAAFEERKNAARRKGEEAGTKLLMPLFIMLLVVMVIVLLPAMLSMG